MIDSYKTKANLGIGVGLLLNIGSRVASYALVSNLGPGQQPSGALVLALMLAGLAGTVLFIYGCVMYAKAKGRNGWWGAFGLLSIIGLIVLVCLRDYAKDGVAPQSRGFEPLMRQPATPVQPPPPYRG